MADTQRTLAALTALLADNTTGDISAQDLRDMLVSLVPSRGGMTIEPADAVETVISAQATWTQIAGTWTSNGDIDMRDWTMSANGVLKYTGTEAQAVMINGKVSLEPGGPDTEYSIAFALDGVQSERFAATTEFSGPHSGAAAVTVPIAGLITVSPNQLLTLWVRNDTGTENATAERATLSVVGFIK